MGRINIYKDKEEPVARWACTLLGSASVVNTVVPYQWDKCLWYRSWCILFNFRPLGAENLLLRGATLKNTQHIYGNDLPLNHGSVVFSRLIHVIHFFSPSSCCNLHRNGDQDGSELPVEISEALSCRKVWNITSFSTHDCVFTTR